MERKVAIVTGSATGVGAATAILLAEKGCNVIINYTKSKKEADETAEIIRNKGVEVIVCQGDVANDDDCRAMAQAAVDAWGRIDYLVNNAGKTKFNPFPNLEGLKKEDFLDIYAVNVVGAYQMIRAVEPHMRKLGQGAIVNNSSIGGVTGIGSSIAYAASKAALNMMTKSLAHVLGPEIRINSVAPGMIQTRWLKEGLQDEAYEKIIYNKKQLVKFVLKQKNLGFVPTMGSIHLGHISLIKKSISQCNKTIVSIFINKPQFNRKIDYQTYPKVLKKDIGEVALVSSSIGMISEQTFFNVNTMYGVRYMIPINNTKLVLQTFVSYTLFRYFEGLKSETKYLLLESPILIYPGFNVDIPFTETFKMNFGFNVGINTLVNDLGKRNITYSLVFGTNF